MVTIRPRVSSIYFGSFLLCVSLTQTISCTSSSSRDGDSDSGSESTDEDTGASVYVPEGREDTVVDEGADVADETTGAYLTIPGDISPASRSINVSASSEVKDDDVKAWRLSIPLTDITGAEAKDLGEKISVFYHIDTEAGDRFYGAIPSSDLEISDEKIKINMLGLGNYQVAILDDDLDEEKQVSTDDRILKKDQVSHWASSVFTLSTGKAVVGLERGHLLVADNSDNETFSSKNNRDGLGSSMIRSVLVDSSDRIVLGTGLGLAISTNGGDSFTNLRKEDGFTSERVNKVINHSGQIYAATNAGISIVNPNSKTVTTTYTTSDGLPDSQIIDLAINSSGTIYAATFEGIFYKTSAASKFSSYTADADNLASDRVNAVFVDSSDRIWAATDGGVSVKATSATSFSNIVAGEDSIDETTAKDIYVNSSDIVFVLKSSGISRFQYLGVSGISNVENFEDAGDVNSGLSFDLHRVSDTELFVARSEGVSKVTITSNNAKSEDLNIE